MPPQWQTSDGLDKASVTSTGCKKNEMCLQLPTTPKPRLLLS